jgi:competence protein ComEC
MKRGVFVFWSILVAVALLRLWQSFDVKAPDLGICVGQNVNGTGIVYEEPERKETGQIFMVSVHRLSVASTSAGCRGDFLIRLKTKLYPRFVYGDLIEFSGRLSLPINFGGATGRTFDYKGYLAKDGVFYEIKSATVSTVITGSSTPEKNVANDGDLIKGLHASDNGAIGWLAPTLYSLKRNFVKNLEKILGEPHAALASGLVVGEKAALGKDLLDDFRIVGLIHIVVLSGYNITIVGDAMRRALSFFPRIWGIGLGGIGIALFGVMVGGGATVVRSCLMAGIALSADLIRREYNVMRALIFAGLAMIVQNPMILLHDPSFQLSFLATIGLILLAGPIERHLRFVPKRFGLRGIVASTLATQVFVSPYILYMMGQFSVIGVVVNILVLPFVPMTMFFVFVAGVVGFISLSFAQVFGWIAYSLLSYELFVVRHFAQMPFASVHLPLFSGWLVVGFYSMFFLILLFVAWRRRVHVISL